jgi:hypothetical protein
MSQKKEQPNNENDRPLRGRLLEARKAVKVEALTAPLPAGEPQEMKQIGIAKQGHSYIVQYSASSETEALCSLLTIALDPRYNFDLNDAVAVMHSLQKKKKTTA